MQTERVALKTNSFSDPADQTSAFQSFELSRNASAGVVKFHEVYLGEAGMETSEFQDGGGSPQGGAGAGGGHLSLEQYICNSREALGVDSHYSRCWVFLR